MCKSQAEGGQRCAAHTRPAYEAAEFGTPEWDKAAAEYASTPTGQEELSGEWFKARSEAKSYRGRLTLKGRVRAADREAYAEAMTRLTAFDKALERGKEIRLANLTAAEKVSARGNRTGTERASRRAEAEMARQRRTLAEDVVWCVNHGYMADAMASVRGFESRFGVPASSAEQKQPSSSSAADQTERSGHAEVVVFLMSSGRRAEAQEEAKRFAERFGGGHDPKMAQEMSALRAR